MADVRFLQIHSLHGYSAVLLNRDDSGLAKRLPYGGVLRDAHLIAVSQAPLADGDRRPCPERHRGRDRGRCARGRR